MLNAVVINPALTGWQRLMSRCFAPVDTAPLVCFRVIFGGVMLWEVWRYTSRGWIYTHYIAPEFHFSYYGFDWIHPLPGDGMCWLFAGMGVLAVGILTGYRYRLCTALFFASFSYIFLVDAGHYLNHFYLICLVSLLLIFMPADDAFSLDARRKPEIRAEMAPAWTHHQTSRWPQWAPAAVIIYCMLQILMPLRHLLYPGYVSWTEEGHRFAWHMKLRDKSGVVRFFVRNVQTGAAWQVDAPDYLTDEQYDEMIGIPDLMLQFAHFIAAEARRDGHSQVEVRVWAFISLNGRPGQLLIDPEVDLARQSPSLLPAGWILPLEAGPLPVFP